MDIPMYSLLLSEAMRLAPCSASNCELVVSSESSYCFRHMHMLTAHAEEKF
jgi:hypothetical protein